jgi:Transposase DDE domain group 1
MTDDKLLPFDLPAVRRKKFTVDFYGGNQSSNAAGGLPMRCRIASIPRTNPLANCEFATLRERLIKIGARVIEHIARIRVQLPTSCSEGALFRAVALGLLVERPHDAFRRPLRNRWQLAVLQYCLVVLW